MKLTGIKNYFKNNVGWKLFSILFLCVIILPLLLLVSPLLSNESSSVLKQLNNTLPSYIFNTFYLVAFSVLYALILAIIPAYLISNYHFFGSKTIEKLLYFPLTIPSYLAAICYSGFFDYSGILYKVIKNTSTGKQFYVDVMNIHYLAFILALVLYPYIYIVAINSFKNTSKSYKEIGESFGFSPLKIFRKIDLPLATPAIISGTLLIVMEVVNDYGAAKYFGVPTFTTGIFKSWFSYGDLKSAIILSLILIGFVIFILFLTHLITKNKKYISANNSTSFKKRKTGKMKSVIFVLITALPFILGFVIPTLQLIDWACYSIHFIFEERFHNVLINTLSLSLFSAIAISILAIVFSYGLYVINDHLITKYKKVAIIGYSLPGAIIAVSIILFSTIIDRYFNVNLFSGSIVFLIYAYIIRFFAIPFTPINSSLEKLPFNYYELGKTNGLNDLKIFFSIHYKMIKEVFYISVVFIFIDIIKELPLTIILRPDNFNTLSTLAFEYASDEILTKSAIPSLVIILFGCIGILLMFKTKSKNG